MSRTITCVFCGAYHAMRCVDTCYGMTGGDKWQCSACHGYAVTKDPYGPRPRPKFAPNAPVRAAETTDTEAGT